MEDAKILLMEEELNAIKNIQLELQNSLFELGSIESQLNDLAEAKSSVLLKLKEVKSRQNQLGFDLNKKYGEGSVNLNSGEFESV